MKSMQFHAALNRASLDYISALLRIADQFHADRDEVIKREIKTLCISVLNSSLGGYQAKPAATSDCFRERLAFLNRSLAQMADGEDEKQKTLLKAWIAEMEAEIAEEG